MHKSWLNYSDQVALLSKRGLSILDPAAVDPILKSNTLLAAGIADPQRYGGMPVELLAPSAE